jgi:uncharacterized metal-binding protein YceD (DUF177 family)
LTRGEGDDAVEFSRPLVADERRGRMRFAIEAGEAERAALARRFSLPSIGRLACSGTLAPAPGGRWRLRARLDAAVTQLCVVSLEPFEARLEEDFEIEFVPADGGDGPELDIGAEDAEPLPQGGELDVGEIAAQQLSLALDPFPRAPSAAWSDRIEAGEEADPQPANEQARKAFAALSRLAGRRGEGSGEA